MVHWAQTIGPHTARLFERILADKPHPEMGYRSCLGAADLTQFYATLRYREPDRFVNPFLGAPASPT